MVCKNCGFTFPDGEKFCPVCNRPVDTDVPEQISKPTTQPEQAQPIYTLHQPANPSVHQAVTPIKNENAYSNTTNTIPQGINSQQGTQNNEETNKNINTINTAPNEQNTTSGFNNYAQNTVPNTPNYSTNSNPYPSYQDPPPKQDKPKKGCLKMTGIFLAGLVLGIGMNSLVNSNKTDDVSTTTLASSTAQQSVASVYSSSQGSYNKAFAEDTLTTTDAVIKYTGSEKGTDYDGKPVVYTFFTITNTSSKKENIQFFLLSYVDFSQNLGSTTKKLGYGITNNSPHKAKLDLLNQDINPGATAEIAYVTDVEDATKPVEVIFKENMFSSNPVGTIEIAP